MREPTLDPGVGAVLSGQQLPVFCERFEVGLEDLESSTSGWGKVAILSPDRAFLFPRDPDNVPGLERALDVLELLDGRNFAPRLLARVNDAAISFYEFGVIERVRGRTARDVVKELGVDALPSFLALTGRAAAACHTSDLGPVPDWIPRGDTRDKRVWRSVRFPDRTADALRWAQQQLDWKWANSTEILDAWIGAIIEVARLDDVLLHGDFGLHHLFVDGETVTGIIDWEAARVDWPVWDFNGFGPWNPDFRHWPGHLRELRTIMWEAYAEQCGLPAHLADGLNLVYAIQQALDTNRPPQEAQVRELTDALRGC